MAVLICGPARADIDYQCLNNCVATGKGGTAACLETCTVGLGSAQTSASSPSSATSPQTPGADLGAGTHRLVSPLSKAPDTLPSAKAKPAPAAEKDHVCMRACLADHNAYGYCEKICTKTKCLPTSVLCTAPQYQKR